MNPRTNHLPKLLILALMLMAACKPKLPEGVLSEGKMERVLYDYHIAQGMTKTAPREEGISAEQYAYELVEAVCRKHGITQAELDTSLIYYCSDLEAMNRIYRHVAKRLEHDAEVYGAASGPRDVYASLTATGDTANVWADRPLIAIKSSVRENLQAWTMECDSTWLPGDDILWRFQTMDIHERGLGNLYADLVVTYDNDSVRAVQQTIVGDQTPELRLNNPKGWTPRRLTGHLYIAARSEARNGHLIIASSFALIRFHKSEEVRRTFAADTIHTDSIPEDSIDARQLTDTVRAITAGDERILPTELRDRQQVEHTINIVREKEYTPVRGNRRKTIRRPVNGKQISK